MEHLVENIVYSLMYNLDQTGTSKVFELDAEFVGIIVKEILEYSPFKIDHINISNLEHYMELCVDSGERIEGEIWIQGDRLRIDLQSEIGRVTF